MKKILVIIASVVVVTAANAQLRKTPSEVTNRFSATYPTAKNVTWRDKLTNFEAEFDLAGAHTVAKFNSKGEWLNTEQDLTLATLNANVKDGLNKSKYKDWSVKEIKSIQVKDKATVYRVVVVKDTGDVLKRYLFFNEQGQLTRDALTI